MRILAFILSFYFAVLSLVPCADGQQRRPAEMGVTEVASVDDHDHSDHEDDCTTLCICACCGTTLTFSTTQNMSDARTVLATDNLFLYHFNYSFSFSEANWHPPAVS